jgi:hypothetical protein
MDGIEVIVIIGEVKVWFTYLDELWDVHPWRDIMATFGIGY